MFIWLHPVLVVACGILTESSGIFTRVLGCSRYGVQAQVLWPVGLAAPLHVDLSSLTRDWTHIPRIARQVLNHWTTTEVPLKSFLNLIVYPQYCHREGDGTPLQHSCLENPMDRGAWWAAVHGVAKSWTRLSNFTFTFHFHALEKEMATHSSVLAWRIPGTGEPGGLRSMGSLRVGHNCSDAAAAAAVLSAISHWAWDLSPSWLPFAG